MRFDELASRAGEHAAEVGRRVGRPSFARLAERRRRRNLVAAWSAASLVIAAMAGGILLTGPGAESPVAAPATTTIISTATSEPRTTTTVTAPLQPAISLEDCPVTFPDDPPFTPPADRQLTLSFEGVAWYGTPELWTFVQETGQVWEGLPVGPDGSLTQKLFWWTDDYLTMSEPAPDIAFHAEDVGGSAPTVEPEQVTTGGHPEMGVFIIAGFEIPQVGCWRVTAEYKGASVSYVAWVEGR